MDRPGGARHGRPQGHRARRPLAGRADARWSWSTRRSPASSTTITSGASASSPGWSEADRAELRGAAVDLVSSFQECFPPLRSAWTPVTESRVRVELFGGALDPLRQDGPQPRPAGGATRPSKVIIDLKSGRPSADPPRGPALLRAAGDHQARRAARASWRSYYLESGPGPPGGRHRRPPAVGPAPDRGRGDQDRRATPRDASRQCSPGPPAAGARWRRTARRVRPSWPGRRRGTATGW